MDTDTLGAETHAKKLNITPKEVLYEQLLYYRDEAIKQGNRIAAILRGEEKLRGDLIFQLYKLQLKNREMLIEIATKLAPYIHPRLESVEVKGEMEHKFVIRAPLPIKDTKTWLAEVGGNPEPLLANEAKKLEDVNRAPEYPDAPPNFELIEPILKRNRKKDIEDIDFVPPEDRFED